MANFKEGDLVTNTRVTHKIIKVGRFDYTIQMLNHKYKKECKASIKWFDKYFSLCNYMNTPLYKKMHG